MSLLTATHFAPLAWREALKEYIENNLKWGKVGDVKSLTVYSVPSDGQQTVIYPCAMIRPSMAPLDDHSTAPTVIEGSMENINGTAYLLCKDGDSIEESVFRIKANNQEEISKVMLRLWPLLNPYSNKAGLKLELGSKYYGQIASFLFTGFGYTGIEDKDERGEGLHTFDIPFRVICPVVKVLTASTRMPAILDVEVT